MTATVDAESGRPRPAMVARAVGITFGGQALLSLAALAAVVDAGLALAARRRPRRLALLGLGALALYELRLAPWMRTWGTTAEERASALPGDDLVPRVGTRIDHAVTIHAPVAEVWPWLAQIGQDRGGFYSYRWLENLAGCEMRNAGRIHPEWQRRRLGEKVMLHPDAPGLAVTIFEPGHAIGLEGWGSFVVEPRGESATRLLARGRVPAGRPSVFYRTLLEVPHFLMQRRMLLGIKSRAEA